MNVWASGIRIRLQATLLINNGQIKVESFTVKEKGQVRM